MRQRFCNEDLIFQKNFLVIQVTYAIIFFKTRGLVVCCLNLNSNCIGTLLLNPRVNLEFLVATVNSSFALFRQWLCNLRCENRENTQVMQN